MTITQTFNEIYEPLFYTDARLIDIWGGRGRGGSHTGTDYFLHMISKPQYFRGYFLRQAFNDIRDSLFRDFKDRIEENDSIDIDDFDINEQSMRFIYKPTGNMILSKGFKSEGARTSKMKSLAGATHVLIEEADEVGEEEFDQMDLSLRTTKGERIQIIRIFNPPHKQHWIWRDYILTPAKAPAGYIGKEFNYFKATPRTDVSLCSIFSTYHDNIENIQASTIEKFESFKKKKPEYYYTTVSGFISEGMRGRIFSGWEPVTNEAFNLIDALSVFGLDFGVNTGGLVEVRIVKNRMYLREQNYEGGTDKEIAIRMCKIGIKDEIIIGDSADPMKISKLRTGWDKNELSAEEIALYPQLLKGFNIYGVAKPPGLRVFGRTLIMDYDVFVTEDSNNLWHEYREHKWALDKNKNPTDEPEDGNDHLIDPTVYVAVSKGRYF